jgi:vacuolar protein sorting-associated protein 13A/C
MSEDVEQGDTRVYKLEHGESLPWIFRDWKKRRESTTFGKNLFGVRIDQCDWESIHHVALDKAGEGSYRLRPDVNGVYHRLIVDIRLENHVKTVTFRSGLVLENNSDRAIQLAIVDKNRRMLTDAIQLKPYESYNVPILLCYNRWVVIRPSERYRWSKQMLMWSDVMLPSSPKCVECPPVEGNEENLMSYKYQLVAEFDKKSPIVKQYPFMKIQFCPPVEVENLLPFDFDLTLTNEMTGERITTFVEQGNTAHLHNMKSDTPLVIQLDLKSDRYKCSDSAVIRTTPSYNGIGEKLVITDQNDVPTNLRMNISRATSTTDSLHVSIYAPYLILNKSGLPICLRPRQTYLQRNVPVESIPAYKEGEVLTPMIFSYPENDRHNRAQISINDSKWSDPISFEAVGNHQDVTLLSKSDNYARHAGINVEEGVGILKSTKLVTITPRYVLKNNMKVPLKFCEFGFNEVTCIEPDKKMALYQTNKSSVRWLCLQLQQLENNWSSPFDIQEIGKTFVKVDKGDGSRPYLVRVSTHLKDSTIFITFNEDDHWPYIIVNKSSIDIQFRQQDIDPEEYDLKSNQRHALPKPRLFTLASGERFEYSWDIPVAKEKRLDLRVGNRHRSINFQAIGAQVPFRYMKHREGPIGSNTLSIDIMADDSALVLRLTDFDLTKSLYRPKSSGTSTLASTSREGSMRDAFETVDVQHITNYVLELNLAGIGISIINRNVQASASNCQKFNLVTLLMTFLFFQQEMAYATIKGLEFKYIDSNMYQSLRFSIQWLQVIPRNLYLLLASY